MFLKYLEPIFKPWRAAKNKVIKVKTVKGNIKGEQMRVKRFGQYAQNQGKKAQGGLKKAQAGAQKAQAGAQKAGGQVQGMAPGGMPKGAPPPQMQGMPQGMPPGMPPPGMPQGGPPMQGQQAGAPPMGINPNPPIKIVGFFKRRKVCTQCNAELDKTWDSCPYCAQAAAAAAQPPAASKKTQAFMINAGAAASPGVQLLGWLVPLKGPLRGELFTLAPQSVIGTDPTCTVVLQDGYMSSHHAEIVAQGGVWVLRDLGSTNGTQVNDKPVTQHELVDNDFIMFGQSLVKFKSL